MIVPLDDGLVIETPRYARFTEILVEIARRGGAIREIAGNDEVMVSLTVPDGAPADLPHGTVLLRLKRDGMPGERLLVNVHVTELAALVRAHRQENPGLEHAFDY